MKRVTSEPLYGRHGAIPYPTYRIFSYTLCISFDSPHVGLYCYPNAITTAFNHSTESTCSPEWLESVT